MELIFNLFLKMKGSALLIHGDHCAQLKLTSTGLGVPRGQEELLRPVLVSAQRKSRLPKTGTVPLSLTP